MGGLAEMEVEALLRGMRSFLRVLFVFFPLRLAQKSGSGKCELPGSGRHTGSLFLFSRKGEYEIWSKADGSGS